MKSVRRLVVGLLSAMALQSAWAQLVTYGSTFGEQSLIVDSRTGLTWLRLDLTTEADYGDLGAGMTFEEGAFAGYRMATHDEVSALISDYVSCSSPDTCFPFSSMGSTNPAVAQDAMYLTSLFGSPVNSAGPGSMSGLMTGLVCRSGCDGSSVTSGLGINLYWSIGLGGSSTNSDRFASPNGMTYMVAAVPEPSTYALMLAGLAAVGLVAKRRGQALAR